MYDYYPESWGSLSHQDAKDELADKAVRNSTRQHLQTYFGTGDEVELALLQPAQEPNHDE